MLSSLLLLVPLLAAQRAAAADACPAPSQPVASSKGYKSYSALGDSYSAGFGSVKRLGLCLDPNNVNSPNCTSAVCAKDVGSYALRFATDHADNFQFLTCSGANSTTILEGQINTPQFGTPDLVSLTAGGNDYSTFANLMTKCVVAGTDSDCQKEIDTAFANLPLIYQNVAGVLDAINKKVSADATKVLLGYLQFFGHGYPDLCIVTLAKQVSVSVRKQINELVVVANGNLTELAQQKGFRYTSPDTLFEGHRWCDTQEQWLISDLVVNRLDAQGAPYTQIPFAHPTDAGQKAYLAAFDAVI